MIPGIYSYAPASKGRIAAATQAVTTQNAYQEGIQSPRTRALATQRDPRAPWVTSYPTTPGQQQRNDPTNAGRAGPTSPLSYPANVYVPRGYDPRATLPAPVSASPRGTLDAPFVASAGTGGL